MRLTSALVALLASSATLLALAACKPKEPPAPPAPAALATEEDKALYALGALVSQNLEGFQLTEKELEIVKRGLSDGVGKKKLEVDVDNFREQVQKLHESRVTALNAKQAEAGKAFMEKAAAEPGAQRTASGLVITELKAGTGASPKATDQVKVHYEGKLIDGTVFDSSLQRGEPATFPLNGVIPCWTEGVQLMKVGGKSRLVCPSELAYGERGSPPRIKPGSTLVFEVELLDIVK